MSLAKNYLESLDEGDATTATDILDYPETALAFLSLFKELTEVSPSTVADRAKQLYAMLRSKADPMWLFDEKDYVLGELARYAGTANRVMGKYDEAERWFERAEASYRHTVNPAPLLANLAYAKLAIRFETHRHADVLDLTPSLMASFRKLGMTAEAAKTAYVQALSLRASGRGAEAFEGYLELVKTLEESGDRSLLGQVLLQMGDYCGSASQFDEALAYYQKALPMVTGYGRPIVLAELKWAIGATYRAQGNCSVALEAYRSARAQYRDLGMKVFEALVGLAIADTLLTLSRPREAEWEILGALPAVEEANLGPEILAAVALLRESARQKKANPEALNELRELLASKR